MTFVSYTTPNQQVSWTAPIFELAAAAGKVFTEIIERQRVKANLGRLSTKDLRDIGLTEHDVASIDHLSMPSNGTLELTVLRKSRSRNW